MLDGSLRKIDYMRISVTDRCNLRCAYCMPAEGVAPVSHSDILTFDEIVRVCGAAASCGIEHIRITGGEPLVRKGIPDLIKSIASVPGIRTVSVTTNGIWLESYAEDLYRAGVRHFNISLDTMDPVLYRQITRGGELSRVIGGIDAVRALPGTTVKTDTVLLGIREQKLYDVAEFAASRDIYPRYIEMMPIGCGKEWLKAAELSYTAEDVRKMLAERYGEPVRSSDSPGHGPASYWKYPGFGGLIGFIPAVSCRFCGDCNRVRLTSQGLLKACLQYESGTDFRRLIRTGADDDELKISFAEAVRRKSGMHSFGSSDIPDEEWRNMSQIGG